MRAALCTEYGPPEVVRIEDLPSPSPGPGQITVRIEAAAVNFPDVLIVANEYQISVPPPFVPGSEFAGRVVETGDGIGDLQPGERVFGTSFVGAFATEIAVAATSVTRIPDGVDARSAAAFGVAHRTAYHSLRSVARVQSGEEVVVLGAGGGVGLAAVQLATVLGASVTAVASSPDKLDAAKANGAVRVLDHTQGDLKTALKAAVPTGADVVIDPVGGDLAEPALRCLHPGGRFVTVGFAAGIPRIPLNLVLLKGVTILGFEFRDFMARFPDDVRANDDALLDLLASGQALPHIGATFPLDNAADALRYVADRRAIGKVVLDI